MDSNTACSTGERRLPGSAVMTWCRKVGGAFPVPSDGPFSVRRTLKRMQAQATRPVRVLNALISIAVVLMVSVVSRAARLEPIPDKLVVLTFDDSKGSHYTVVLRLL